VIEAPEFRDCGAAAGPKHPADLLQYGLALGEQIGAGHRYEVEGFIQKRELLRGHHEDLRSDARGGKSSTSFPDHPCAQVDSDEPAPGLSSSRHLQEYDSGSSRDVEHIRVGCR